MEKLISFFKTEFPKDALEIQECIELLKQCIGGTVCLTTEWLVYKINSYYMIGISLNCTNVNT